MAGSEPQILHLPPQLDFEGARWLHSTLSEAQGQPVRINAEKVSFVGGLAAQILLSAQLEWKNMNIGFSVKNPSDGFCAGIERLGLAETIVLEGN